MSKGTLLVGGSIRLQKAFVVLYFICPHLVGHGARKIIVTQLLNVDRLVS